MSQAGFEALLRTWAVVPAQLERLYGNYCRDINAELAEHCVAAAGPELAPRVERIRRSVAKSSWTSPALARAHRAASQRALDAAAIARIASALEEVNVGEAPPTHLAGPSRDAARFERAHLLLTWGYPRMARAIDILVREVVWSSDGSSPSDAFGAVRLTIGLPLEGVIEQIVDEATRLEFVVRAAFYEPGLDDGAMAVLREVVAAQRTAYALDACWDHFQEPAREALTARICAMRARSRESVEALEAKSGWTEASAELLACLRRDVERPIFARVP